MRLGGVAKGRTNKLSLSVYYSQSSCLKAKFKFSFTLAKLPKWFGERPGKKPGDPESPDDEEDGPAEAPPGNLYCQETITCTSASSEVFRTYYFIKGRVMSKKG